MRAAVLNDTHQLEVAEVPDPTPGTGELVLQVTACGICGSDLKLRPSMPAGLVMGHEFCGEIVATGADTDDQLADRSPRDRAAAHRLRSVSRLPRGRARALRTGRHGRRRWKPGRVRRVRPRRPTRDGGPPRIASILRSAHSSSPSRSVCTRSSGRTSASGDKVLVVGAGPVGLSVIAWAAQDRRERARGVRPVGGATATRPRSSARPAPSIRPSSRSNRATTS